MKSFYKIFPVFVIAVVIAGCKKDEPVGTATGIPIAQVYKAPANFRVVGYIQSDEVQSGQAGVFDMSRINYLNITFSDTTASGELPTIKNLDFIIAAAHKNNVKVLACIGNSSTTVYDLSTDATRANYIKGLMTSVEGHQFDGVDVDIEGDRISKKYEPFVGALSAALKLKGKLMTAAIATWEKDWFTDKALSYFDYLNVMSYDATGPWDPADPGPHSPYSMAVADLNYWTNTRGLTKDKLNLGVPFYGYGFGSGPASTLTYAQIVSKYPGAENKDQLTASNGYIIYYNGIPTMESKTSLAMQSAGGVMIWELMYDASGDKSLLTAIDKTANPGND